MKSDWLHDDNIFTNIFQAVFCTFLMKGHTLWNISYELLLKQQDCSDTAFDLHKTKVALEGSLTYFSTPFMLHCVFTQDLATLSLFRSALTRLLLPVYPSQVIGSSESVAVWQCWMIHCESTDCRTEAKQDTASFTADPSIRALPKRRKH